jgi:hypothetical protein
MSITTAYRNRIQQRELRRLVLEESGFEQDVLDIGVAVKELILSQKATPVPLANIQRDIMEIITLKRLSVKPIVVTKRPGPRGPKDWTEEEEDIFFHWIHDTFTEDLWIQNVMAPIFQGDVRPWEDSIEGWRLSLQMHLDQWIVRSMELITQIYPPEEEEEDEGAEFNTHAFTGKSRNYN